MPAKIAIFHWGELSVHTYYLAMQLSIDGIDADLYLYTPPYANKKFYIKTLLLNLKNKNINIIEFRCTSFERKIIQLHKIAEFLNCPWPAIFTNPLLPLRTSRLFNAKNYKYIITVSPSSLYWLYRTEKYALQKAIHYSLEIEKITDPNVKKHSVLYTILKKETKLLQWVKALMIQDRLRAENLLNSKTFRKDLQVFYIPVSIPGDVIKKRSDYLYERLNIMPHQKIILYFGAVYHERKVDELADAFTQITNTDWVLVIHGAGEFSRLAKTPNIKISNLLLEYADLHLIISSATVGIAFYDNNWPNTGLTAFSSEKIARYLQAGVPFIALRNENYLSLKREFNCCELVENVSELERAIAIILNDYDSYRNECYKAYDKYYNIEHTLQPLTKFLIYDK